MVLGLRAIALTHGILTAVIKLLVFQVVGPVPLCLVDLEGAGATGLLAQSCCGSSFVSGVRKRLCCLLMSGGPVLQMPILFIELLHFLGLDDGGGHLEVEGLDIADEVVDATGHHHIGCAHTEHREWVHRLVTQHWWKVQRLNRF